MTAKPTATEIVNAFIEKHGISQATLNKGSMWETWQKSLEGEIDVLLSETEKRNPKHVLPSHEFQQAKGEAAYLLNLGKQWEEGALDAAVKEMVTSIDPKALPQLYKKQRVGESGIGLR